MEIAVSFFLYGINPCNQLICLFCRFIYSQFYAVFFFVFFFAIVRVVVFFFSLLTCSTCVQIISIRMTEKRSSENKTDKGKKLSATEGARQRQPKKKRSVCLEKCRHKKTHVKANFACDCCCRRFLLGCHISCTYEKHR